MTTNNDITNDRITNALKGDKDKYRTGREAIFGSKEDIEATEEILDKLTQDNEDMGLYD